MASDLVAVYKQGLRDLASSGRKVPSVLGEKSKASNFGKGDRPWTELTGHTIRVDNTKLIAFSPPPLRTHYPYLIGLLAWTLDARNDVDSLAYYRNAARDYSDDGSTMCGAFGTRLFGLRHTADQLAAIVARLRADPASRRTFAAICASEDNLIEKLEYPCAAGVQLFLRDSKLHWLTVMRAQQALTVLPYDAVLFAAMHHFIASQLGVEVGTYTHFSGTFHIYDNEWPLAQQVVESEISTLEFPALPPGKGQEIAQELIQLETHIRTSAEKDATNDIEVIAGLQPRWEFNQVTRDILVEFARTKLPNAKNTSN